jgi:hypothetical protein
MRGVPLSFQLLALLPQFRVRPLLPPVRVLTALGGIDAAGRRIRVVRRSHPAAGVQQSTIGSGANFLITVAFYGHGRSPSTGLW